MENFGLKARGVEDQDWAGILLGFELDEKCSFLQKVSNLHRCVHKSLKESGYCQWGFLYRYMYLKNQIHDLDVILFF